MMENISSQVIFLSRKALIMKSEHLAIKLEKTHLPFCPCSVLDPKHLSQI